MGQKTNPLGFRLGITQRHHSVWFEEPKNYSASLQEDQKIRNFLKKYVEDTIYNYGKKKKKRERNQKRERYQKREINQKSVRPPANYEGLIRIIIQKKIVHTKRTFIHIKNSKGISKKFKIQKAIIRVIICSSFIPINKTNWKRDVRKQEFYYNYPKTIFIQILKSLKPYSQPNLIAELIAFKLKERIPFRKIMQETIDSAREQGDTKGMKIRIAGCIEGREKALRVYKREGRLPLQRIRAQIDYCSHTIQTIHGVLGLKIWVFKKGKIDY
uniref:ribosomal protein S3 n=1 Tax=Juncus gracilicaulis TaxID=511724 RepID=UPI001F12FEBB|nr:ribosomal protein S3 [Juncus gracilicaulis]YP_010291261.1 ribosomal protein S3 [Juncus gracilicaulis]ULQ66827.1 ribosomal protein S3 [Juncus gracilicaulis]ULQ66851.1 ribosomal protein S3 [Juncus gracilicaulis]